MARRSGPLFHTSPLLSSTPPSHPLVVVEADAPPVVAVTVAVEPTATALPVLTKLPLVRQLKVQSRHLESEDAKSLALDVLLLSLLSQDVPQALIPVPQPMRARLPKPPSEAVEPATEMRMSMVSR